MAVGKSVQSSSLAEVLDRILDKGLVIDIWARISLVGIELVTIEARIIVASIEKFLIYADAMGQTVKSSALPASGGREYREY